MSKSKFFLALPTTLTHEQQEIWMEVEKELEKCFQPLGKRKTGYFWKGEKRPYARFSEFEARGFDFALKGGLQVRLISEFTESDPDVPCLTIKCYRDQTTDWVRFATQGLHGLRIVSPSDYQSKSAGERTYFSRLLYTPKQEKCARQRLDGFVVFKGPAGSGKSTIAIWRAVQIAMRSFDQGLEVPRILVTSFNNKLSESLGASLTELCRWYGRNRSLEAADYLANAITIRPVHKEAARVWHHASPSTFALGFRDFQIADAGNTLEEHLETARKQCDSHGITSFLPNEFLLNLFRFELDQPGMSKEYFVDGKFAFHNLHVRISRSEREEIWAIYEHFNAAMRKAKLLTFTRQATIAATCVDDRHRYDYVLIDEAQDLGKGQLVFLLNLLKPFGSMPFQRLTLFFDTAQAIYNPFFWPDDPFPIKAKNTLSASDMSTRSTYLDSSFRIPPRIARLSDRVKSCAHNSEKGGLTSSTREGVEGNVGWATPEILEDEQLMHIGLARNAETGVVPVHGYKGLECSKVVFHSSDEKLKYEWSVLVDRLHPDRETRVSLRRLYYDVMKVILEKGTTSAHEYVASWVDPMTSHLPSEKKPAVERAVKLFFSAVDRWLRLHYVGITRAQDALYFNIVPPNRKDWFPVTPLDDPLRAFLDSLIRNSERPLQ
jgi:superfamily I DNA/RNA helicase